MKPSQWLAAGLTVMPVSLVGQGVAVGAARWLTSPRVSEYRLGMDGFSYGAVSFRPTIQYLVQGGESRAAWGGAGGDVIVRTTPAAQPYLLGGMALGLGRAAASGGLGPAVGVWGGVGAELFTVGPMGFQAEAMYTWRSRMGVESISLGLRIGSRIGRERAESRAVPVGPVTPAAGMPSAAPGDEETIKLATAAPVSAAPMAGVAGTALAVMGTPYRWGGEGVEGFDCSGLIRYAYAQHGITLPRRSVDQAQAGGEVGRELQLLKPGDILTFAAEPGGSVAHVGLYVGEGRFIHSASGGVQTSLLASEDLAGGWWLARWVGARRILDQ